VTVDQLLSRPPPGPFVGPVNVPELNRILARVQARLGVLERVEAAAGAAVTSTDIFASLPLDADTNELDSGNATVLRITPSGVFRINGLRPPAAAERKRIYNIGGVNMLLTHNSGAAPAGSAFTCQGLGDIRLGPGFGADCVYDPVSTVWRASAL
jgi:hypothetical protein